MTKYRALFALFALVLLTASAGCSQFNVRHLERQPWQLQNKQTLELEFWHFSYQPIVTEDSYGVRARALPVPSALPEWGAHFDELWFAVYLSDSRGRVLAKDVQVLLPRDYTPELARDGIPLDFVISPEDIGQGEQLYVTFGYRMVLTEIAPSEGATPRVFFANEGALSRL